ncbi:MAG: acetate/propionate family kinase [Pseudomonadota bacterium]
MLSGGVLVINAGSSSIKSALVGRDGAERLRLAASEIGGNSSLNVEPANTARTVSPVALAHHADAMDAILSAIVAEGFAIDRLDGVGHRIVHGGPTLHETSPITAQNRALIEAAIPLAPLHLPPALAAIDALSSRAPDLRQFGCFDTAFHATIPDVARRYALPQRPETEGLRRYGFHGISYQGLVAALQDLAGPLPPRLLALHLGNGASLCAIKNGCSVATTMGYSPLSGLTMGTRVGTIDGDAVLTLAERVGIARAGEILSRESGLKGLAGASDMRALADDLSAEAAFALDHFAYWAVRHAGSMVAAMGGCDAIAFTAGIGENDAGMRARILSGLEWLGLTWDGAANTEGRKALHRAGSKVSAFIVPAREEATIAADVLAALTAA